MCHVLLIEDEWIIADHIADLAMAAGASSIEIAAREIDAIAAADHQLPAIILSDVRLLEGTGPRAVAAIQAKYGCIPVIFITATSEACLSCDPPAIVLEKPVNERVLQKRFRELVPL